ncbi:hypothetical protein CF326_g9748 [Tilletia indica]|nr:hypothetical protein CF326_g9748 [Tilletia indica]
MPRRSSTSTISGNIPRPSSRSARTSIPATFFPPGRTTSSASYTKRASSNASSPRTSTPSSVWPVCLRPSYLGNADEGVDKIATICGWAEELEKLMEPHHEELKTEHVTLLSRSKSRRRTRPTLPKRLFKT